MKIRELTLKDANQAMLNAGYNQRSSELIIWGIQSKIKMANDLNELAPTFGINTPYLPGDMLLCKLNLVKMKKPRKNPSYKETCSLCHEPVKKADKVIEHVRPGKDSPKRIMHRHCNRPS